MKNFNWCAFVTVSLTLRGFFSAIHTQFYFFLSTEDWGIQIKSQLYYRVFVYKSFKTFSFICQKIETLMVLNIWCLYFYRQHEQKTKVQRVEQKENNWSKLEFNALWIYRRKKVKKTFSFICFSQNFDCFLEFPF